MNSVLRWWDDRETREKRMLAILAALVVVCLYGFALISPLNTSADRAQQEYERALANAVEQRSKAQAILQADSGRGNAATMTVQTLQQAAGQAGLLLESAIVERGGTVRLTFGDVDAAVLAQWMAVLPDTHGASIETMQIQRSDPGLVSATVTVRGAR